jgi:hypothetical protein
MAQIELKVETERIDVTRTGILPPYEADHMRKFIPGLTTIYVTVDGVELPPMTPEQYAAWKEVDAHDLP